MAAAKKAKTTTVKGKKCYKSNAIAARVAGGHKARGKRVKVSGRCVEVL